MWKPRFFLTVFLSLTIGAATVWAETEPLCDFSAPLSCNKIGPKPAETEATGEANFTLREDGKELVYELAVDRIENVTMAHLHIGDRNRTGPIIVWLYPPRSRKAGEAVPIVEGTLIREVIHEEDLRGPFAGKTLEDLVKALRSGHAYVNIHTTRYITGELRGQVNPALAGR